MAVLERRLQGMKLANWTVLCAVACVTHGAQVPEKAAEASPRHSLTFLMEGDAFVAVRAGEFTMGSATGNADEAPPHRVRISKGFEIGKFEVTQAQWRAVLDSPHSKPRAPEELKKVDPSQFKGASLPVESVSWDAVQEFLEVLNSRDKKYSYRLPTEAEWEYVASLSKASDGWCETASEGKTHPVGEKRADALGLHDVLGNVMEWVEDWYLPEYYEGSPRADPRGPAKSSYKVYRGGAWLSAAKQCRAAYRGFDFPNTGYYSVGFRLVRTRR